MEHSPVELFKDLRKHVENYRFYLEQEQDQIRRDMRRKLRVFHDVLAFSRTPSEYVSRLRYALDSRDHEEMASIARKLDALEHELWLKMCKYVKCS
jgi:hypothetical protein